MRSQGRPSVQSEVYDADFEEIPPNGHGGGGSGGAIQTVRQPAAGMTRVAAQYTTAMVCPVKRDIRKVRDAVLIEAELAGEDFMFAWTQGEGNKRTTIEGVSIDGAMILCRNWGNCIPEIEIVEDAPSHWLFRATFIDLETGMTIPRLFRKTKEMKLGKMDAERKLDIALQIGVSKAQRNVILKAMPVHLVNAAIEASKKGAAASIVDLPKEIEKAIGAWGSRSVTQAELESYLGASRSQWNKGDCVRLRSVWRAINERQTTIENEFRPKADEPPIVNTPDKQPPPAQEAQAAQAAEPPKTVDPYTNVVTGEPKAPEQATQPASPPPPAQPEPAKTEAPKEEKKEAAKPEGQQPLGTINTGKKKEEKEKPKEEKPPMRQPGED